jgi:hypothetical protein
MSLQYRGVKRNQNRTWCCFCFPTLRKTPSKQMFQNGLRHWWVSVAAQFMWGRKSPHCLWITSCVVKSLNYCWDVRSTPLDSNATHWVTNSIHLFKLACSGWSLYCKRLLMFMFVDVKVTNTALLCVKEVRSSILCPGISSHAREFKKNCNYFYMNNYILIILSLCCI